MEFRPGLKERRKLFHGFSSLELVDQDRKTLALFLLVSLMVHVLFFMGILLFHHFERVRPLPKVIQVDLVSFTPGPEGGAKIPQAPKAQTPEPEEAAKTAEIPLEPQPLPDPAPEPAPEPVAMLKPDISLKTKPKNLKEIMAAREKEREKEKKKKKPEKRLKPKVDPEKELEKARQRLAEKIDTQKEKQISNALKRLRESVETRGSGSDQGQGSGMAKKGYKPIDLYKMVLQSAIEQNWVFNDVLARMDQGLQVRILIKILKSGEIRDITYETRSGNRYLDESAKKAIKRANPLPELPPGMRSYDVVVIFTPKGLK
ncbi:energy transducer TonB [Desulfospira joergensenii]|uniref:energy transducer TonB n=1 Tax=Desulfospira joergensenii TaxID=53329 RepID=UPI0003B481F0|nr:TonB family protein [Desulfospira joergensenii]